MLRKENKKVFLLLRMLESGNQSETRDDFDAIIECKQDVDIDW